MSDNYCGDCGEKKVQYKECPNCPKRYRKVVTYQISPWWALIYTLLGLFSLFIGPITRVTDFLGGLAFGMAGLFFIVYLYTRKAVWEEVK